MIGVSVAVALLLANAFFVGAEFAAMAARRSQLEPLADDGSIRARSVLVAMDQMGSILATAQLGITVCSVLLGAVSEASLHEYFVPILERFGIPVGVAEGIALALALLVIVYLHVVIGEMIPKNLALVGPDRAAMAMVPPLLAMTSVLGSSISVMERLAKAVVRLFGIEPRDQLTSEFTAEEVHHIVEESHREGLVEQDQYGLLGAALTFRDLDADDVAVPVADLVTVGPNVTPEDIERLVARHGFSRYPTVDATGEPDGYLHLKDVLYADDLARSQPIPRRRVRPLATVRTTDGVDLVLQTMQRSGAHLARVVEPDGNARATGVVFLEDVLEELVGEVSDASQRLQRPTQRGS